MALFTVAQNSDKAYADAGVFNSQAEAIDFITEADEARSSNT